MNVITRSTEENILGHVNKKYSLKDLVELMDDKESFLDFIDSKLAVIEDGKIVSWTGFDMSGYNSYDGTKNCREHNQKILNMFSDFWLFEYVNFLIIECHKGAIYSMWQTWDDSDNDTFIRTEHTCEGTGEIIYNLYEMVVKDTFYSDCERRRYY